MKIFIDTANLDEIRKAESYGVIAGVTTNPSLVAKENGDFEKIITEITKIVDGPISAEVLSLEAEKMIEEGKKLAKKHKKRRTLFVRAWKRPIGNEQKKMLHNDLY